MISQKSRTKKTSGTITYRALLGTYLRPQWAKVALMSLLLLTSIALQLLNPQLLRSFIDTAINGGAYTILLTIGGLFVGIALLNQAVSVGATYMSELVAWTATNWLRRDLVAHCLNLDMTFHQVYTPGALIERIDGDANTLATFFSQVIINLVGNMLLLLGVVALLFRIDWRLGASMIAFIFLALGIMAGIHKYAVPRWVANRQKSAEFFGFLGEHLEGTEEIRANGANNYVLSRFFLFLRAWLPITRESAIAGFSTWMTIVTIFALGNTVAFIIGAYLLSIHTITLGTVYLIFYYTNLIVQPIEQIRDQVQELQAAAAGMERIQQLLQTRSALADGIGEQLPAGPLAVDFQHVTFGYAANEPVLHDLTLHVAPGRVLGLLGRTGSGKTTLVRLLLRFYDVQEGEIRLGDVPVKAARLHDLRRHIGMVSQEVQLFHGSVRDNLTFFDRSVADTNIITVLKEVGLTRWFASLQEGLDTEIGAGGAGLSAGESQLLACARVFLSNPGLVILDEASSRLDLKTERVMEQAMQKLLRGRTAIIIAHRLSTVQHAHEILILQDGHILEHGSQTALRSDSTSHYARLLETGLQEVLQ
ncbi:MAG TPA: ABC transporter ATP-binding protein [Ktedonobacteraceae bacterium]|nr:ABC transporter ATP-binding protein [Ktedonobacteraceae bacterium]